MLGEVTNGKMKLGEISEIAEECWRELPKHFKFVALDEFVIMPDHMHGILVVGKGTDDKSNRVDSCDSRDVQLNIPTPTNSSINHQTQDLANSITSRSQGELFNYFSSISPKRGLLPVVIRSYKGAVTTECRRRGLGFVVWQSGFFDYIIHNDLSLAKIRRYIQQNPARWGTAEHGPGDHQEEVTPSFLSRL